MGDVGRPRDVTHRRLPGGDVLALPVARSFGRRALGLMGRRVRNGDALLFPRCAAVHTWGMRSPIDVVFLAADGRVLRVVPELGPWRFARHGAADDVLELAAGAACALGIEPGVVLAPGGDAGHAAAAAGASS